MVKSLAPNPAQKGEEMQMKSNQEKIIALHVCYEKTDGRRIPTAYVSNGEGVERLTGAKLNDFVRSLKTGGIVRLTAVRATDSFLFGLAERGVKLLYTHWHQTGIAKNLPPEEIVATWAKLPNVIFRQFQPRPDIAQLRHALSLRGAVVRFYGDAVRAVKQEARNIGLADEDSIKAEPLFKQALEKLSEIRTSVVSEEGTQLDTYIGKLAAKIPECVMVRRILHVQEWISAAAFVAFSGGFERFPSVAAFWRFCGQSVENGKAPKRMRGVPSHWSPAMRTAVYLVGTAIIRNRANPWRAFYEAEYAKEFAAHDAKCPNCKTKQGHCGARARRKMMKEILKRIWVAGNGKRFDAGHAVSENQRFDVGLGTMPSGEAATPML
jgi:hypothetical protein